MRKNGWVTKYKKKFKITTDSDYDYLVCKNLLNRDFMPDNLNQAWASDLTYIKTQKGCLYLTTIIDLYGRQIIGWSLSTGLYTRQTVIPSWRMAIGKRKITQSMLFHSDRGIQYASRAFKNVLMKSSSFITQSMSRRANCWDNASSILLQNLENRIGIWKQI